jgi:uncharacterized spore protein YtfJ
MNENAAPGMGHDEAETHASIAGQSLAATQDMVGEFLDTASVERVYGTPLQHGDTTIIPAAEVLVALGFGLGAGGGGPCEPGSSQQQAGYGSGGGGGGRTLSRPVAVIVASPAGVRVEPVVDPTKIVLAALTTFGFMIGLIMRMKSTRMRPQDH